MSRDFNFKRKIECIYKVIANSDVNSLTKLFFVKKSDKDNKYKFNNRLTHIKKWLNAKDNFVPRLFKNDYFKYEFSKYNIDNIPLFKDAEEFLYIDLDEFCKRINLYNKHMLPTTKREKLKYNYMYVFAKDNTINDFKIDQYQIIYEDSLSDISTEIELVLPKYKQKKFNENSYKGTITIDSSKILLKFQNSFDSAMAIFNHSLNIDTNNFSIGTIVGIADVNQIIPVAKKVLISKTEITDYSWLYLILNENEVIYADDNIYYNNFVNIDFKKQYLYRYFDKLKDVENVIKKSSKNYFKSIYYQLAFNEFYELNKTFEHLKNNSPYAIIEHINLLNTVFDSYSYEKYDSLSIVISINSKNQMHNYFIEDLEKLKNRINKLSESVNIEIIFIINECISNFSIEFKNFVNSIKDNTKILFANKKELEHLGNSLDFVFTSKKNFVAVKLLRTTKQHFRLFIDKITIKEYETLYYKIKNRAISLQNFYNNSEALCAKITPLMQILSREWFMYLHINSKVIEFKIKIETNLDVKMYYKNNIRSVGKILNKEYQSIILLEGVENKRLTTITFDNLLYELKKAFVIKVVGKEYETNSDIMAIGILSKVKIDNKIVIKILSESDNLANNISYFKNKLNSYFN